MKVDIPSMTNPWPMLALRERQGRKEAVETLKELLFRGSFRPEDQGLEVRAIEIIRKWEAKE